MRHFTFLLIVSALLAPSFVMAASERGGAAVVRLNISAQPEKQAGLFGGLGGFLGARRVARQYPEPGTKYVVSSSAYAPSPYQTDSTPCITAAGTKVRPGTVASNFLPMGTILKIDGETYIVEDRMNQRYWQTIDIFFPATSDALEFGRQSIEVEVVGYGQPGQIIRGVISEEGVNQFTNQPQKTSTTDKLKGNFYILRRIAKNLLGAKVSDSVNRYDVDCFD